MSYLQHPLDFTRPEVPQLRDLFVRAYRRESAAEELADQAGIVPGTFPYYPMMRTTWTELVKVMALQGKLRTMVEIAASDPTVADYNQRFQDMLSDQPAVPAMAATPPAGWWKGRDADPRLASKLHLQRLMEKRARLFDIELARRVVGISRSVARLDLRFPQKAYGTGFLVQPDLILTNHHNVVHEDHGDVQAMTVEFDYETVPAAEKLVRQGKIDTIVGDSVHDWAVIQLDSAVDLEPLALGTSFHIGQDDAVVIIQHPLGAFKKFALDPMSIQHVDTNVIQYLADTQGGSSGSPVFNVEMHVIALHHAEEESTVQVAGGQETVWRNEGIHIDRVMEGLEANGIAVKSSK